MSSSALNVFRWSALGLGVVYGFFHNRTLASVEKAEHEIAEYKKKEKLIAEAKAEYAKLHPPAVASGVVSDITDPKFDLVKYLDYALAESK